MRTRTITSSLRRGGGVSTISSLLIPLVYQAAFLAALANTEGAAVATCAPSFPYQQGWYGGDSAASIYLPDSAIERNGSDSIGSSRRTLWLFGDSFVAPNGTHSPPFSNRYGTLFLHNTVALGTCSSSGEWSIDYKWTRDEEGQPSEVFVPPADGINKKGLYYWPLTGVYHRGSAYVVMVGVRSEGANFELTQTVIARVSNPAEHDVTKWNVDYRTIFRHKQYFPAGAAVIDGDHLYIMGWKQPNEDHRFGRQFLSRIALDDLNKFEVDLSARLQVYTKADEWGLMKDRKKNSEARPKIIMKGTQATEMGLQKLPNECGWLVTLSEAFDAASFAPSKSNIDADLVKSRRTLVRGAADRPHSRDRPAIREWLRSVHRMLRGQDARRVKSSESAFVHIYICNLFGPANPFELWERMDLYVPRAVSIDFPTPGKRRILRQTVRGW